VIFFLLHEASHNPLYVWQSTAEPRLYNWKSGLSRGRAMFSASPIKIGLTISPLPDGNIMLSR
jgi:hypothetical protein